MSFFKVTKSDETTLVNLFEETIDITTADIALVGQGATDYGLYVNENFIKLLENFSSRSKPKHPLTGQLWFDKADKRLKVYDSEDFAIIGTMIVSPTLPEGMLAGDLWDNSIDNQLRFFDGEDLTLSGPIYKDSQGVSGFKVETVLDTQGKSHVITGLWSGGVLIGIFSGETEPFALAETIANFDTTVKPGFNESNLPDLKFYTTARAADAILRPDGVRKFVSSFMRTDRNTGTVGTVTIDNNRSLVMGISQTGEIQVVNGNLRFVNNVLSQSFRLIVDNNTVLSARFNPNTIGVMSTTPTEAIDVGTTARIRGNLTFTDSISPREDTLTFNSQYTNLNSTRASAFLSGFEINRGASPLIRFQWRETTDTALPGDEVNLATVNGTTGTGYWVTTDYNNKTYRTLTYKDLNPFSLSGSLTDLDTSNAPALFVWKANATPDANGNFNWSLGIPVFALEPVVSNSTVTKYPLTVEGTLRAKNFGEPSIVLDLNNATIDARLGNHFSFTLNNSTIISSIINIPPSPEVFMFSVKIENTSEDYIDITWPSSIVWSTKCQPIIEPNSTNLFGFRTSTNGASWQAFPLWPITFDTIPESLPIPARRTFGMQAAITVGSGYFIDNERKLYAAGYVNYEPFNVSRRVKINPMTEIIPGVKFKMIANDVWNYGGMALDESGKIWSYGTSDSGQYGVPPDPTGWFDAAHTWPPIQVHTEDTWKYIFASEYYTSFGIKEDGTLWAWGENVLSYQGTFSSGWVATSTDNGTTWDIELGKPALKGLDFIDYAANGSRIIATVRPVDEGLFENNSQLLLAISDDNGVSWEIKNLDYLQPQFSSNPYVVYISYENSTWFVTTNYCGILKSIDNGETWSVVTIASPTDSIGSFRKLRYGNNVYFTVRSSGSGASPRSLRSTDLTTWTIPLDSSLYDDCVFDGSKFIVTAWTFLLTSVDGLTWSSSAVPWNSLTYPRSLYYLNGRIYGPGRDTLWSSLNGTTWSNVAPTYFTSMTYDSISNKWIGIDQSNSILGTSTDGVTWLLDYKEDWGAVLKLILVLNNTWISLGDGAIYEGPRPTLVGTLADNNWCYVEGFYWNAYGWRENGDLYAWGYNFGWSTSMNPPPGATNAYNAPQLLTPFYLGNYPDFDPKSPKRKIAWVSDASLLIKPDGTLWAGGRWHEYTGYDAARWGTPSFGIQLGTDNDWDFVASMAEYYVTAAIKKNGEIYIFGELPRIPGEGSGYRFYNLEKVELVGQELKEVDTGFLNSCFQVLTKDGQLINFGESSFGEAGDRRSGEDDRFWPIDDWRWNIPVNDPNYAMTNVDWVYTDYWSVLAKKKTGEVYGWGMNDLDGTGLFSDLDFYSTSIPLRLFNINNQHNTDSVSIQDRIEIWKQYVVRYHGGFSPYDVYEEPGEEEWWFDGWYYEPLRGWAWNRGLGWWVGPTDYPVAGWPSDRVERDYSIPYHEWDWEDGLLWIGEDWQKGAAFQKLKHVSYLYFYSGVEGTLEEFCQQMFQHLETVETFDIDEYELNVLDFNNFPVLDVTRIRSIFISSSITDVLNMPPGLGSNITGDTRAEINVRGAQLDATSRQSVYDTLAWEYVVLRENTNLKFSDFNPNAKMITVRSWSNSDVDLASISNRSTRNFELDWITVTNPVQSFNVNVGFKKFYFRSPNCTSLSVLKSNNWVEDDGDTYLPNYHSWWNTIYFSDCPMLQSVHISGYSASVRAIEILFDPALTTVTGFEDPLTVTENIIISGCDNLATLFFLRNIVALGGTINISSSIASNPGFVKIPSSSWLAQPAQASKFVNSNQSILCDI
jgi:alpha-tubulin suppressor-like RCC1 family protein